MKKSFITSGPDVGAGKSNTNRESIRLSYVLGKTLA